MLKLFTKMRPLNCRPRSMLLPRLFPPSYNFSSTINNESLRGVENTTNVLKLLSSQDPYMKFKKGNETVKHLTVDIASKDYETLLTDAKKAACAQNKVLRVFIENSGTVGKSPYYGADAVKVEALILPGELYWPQFHFPKQKIGKFGENIICRKCSVADVWRDEETRKALLSGKSPDGVGWIGAPGIGKSLGMGFQLADLLQAYRHINVPGNVFLRSSVSAFKVSFSREGNDRNENEEINVTVERLCGENTIDEFRKILGKNLRETKAHKDVLFLELDENEIDPGFQIPTFETASSNDAEKVLKVPLKTDGFLLFLIQPWLKEEFRLVVALFLVLAPESKVEFGDDVFSDNDDKENSWQYRYDQVGGIPRCLFSLLNFTTRLVAIKSQGEQFFDATKRLSIYNLPSECKFYMAPFLLPECKTAELSTPCKDILGIKLNYCFQFLSEPARKVIFSFVKLPAHLQALERCGLDYQYHQDVMLYGGLLQRDESYNLPDAWKKEKWDLEGCGLAQKGKFETGAKVIPDYIETLPVASTSVAFNSQVLMQDLSTLRDNAYYYSKVDNGYLYDFLCVNHADKTIHLIQITTKSPREHAISLPAFAGVFNGLELDSEANKSYQISYTLARPILDAKRNATKVAADIYVKFKTTVDAKVKEVVFSLAELYEASYEQASPDEYILKLKNSKLRNEYRVSREVCQNLLMIRRITRFGLIRFGVFDD